MLINAGTNVWPVKGKLNTANNKWWAVQKIALTRSYQPVRTDNVPTSDRFSLFNSSNKYRIVLFPTPIRDENDSADIVVYGFIVKQANILV